MEIGQIHPLEKHTVFNGKYNLVLNFLLLLTLTLFLDPENCPIWPLTRLTTLVTHGWNISSTSRLLYLY